jgi:hypothetical protein
MWLDTNDVEQRCPTRMLLLPHSPLLCHRNFRVATIESIWHKNSNLFGNSAIKQLVENYLRHMWQKIAAGLDKAYVD